MSALVLVLVPANVPDVGLSVGLVSGHGLVCIWEVPPNAKPRGARRLRRFHTAR